MKLKFVVIFEQGANNYCAYAPDVPGCISTGKTWKKMQKMIREALTFHIEFMMENGEPIPEPRMSVEEAMLFHIQLSAEPDPEFDEYDDVPSLSTTFAMVEIEVAAPIGAPAIASQLPC